MQDVVRYGYFSRIVDMVVYNSEDLKDMVYSFLNCGSRYQAANKQRENLRREFVVQPMGETWERIGQDINNIIKLNH